MNLPPDVKAKCLELAGVKPGKRPSKYRSRAVTVDNVWFASEKEARRWSELQMLELAGKISDLRRQVRIPIIVNGVTVAHYVADAVYVENGKEVTEDVKSPVTRRMQVFRLKKRCLAAMGIEIREV